MHLIIGGWLQGLLRQNLIKAKIACMAFRRPARVAGPSENRTSYRAFWGHYGLCTFMHTRALSTTYVILSTTYKTLINDLRNHLRRLWPAMPAMVSLFWIDGFKNSNQKIDYDLDSAQSMHIMRGAVPVLSQSKRYRLRPRRSHLASLPLEKPRQISLGLADTCDRPTFDTVIPRMASLEVEGWDARRHPR